MKIVSWEWYNILKNVKKGFIILTLIFTVGVVLRFYGLGDVPPALHRDEAFLGYNAYSILKTGRDISGTFLPLHLESFLFSPAGYSYLSIPFIALFGLNGFSTRFGSALFGSFTILITYFLVKELFFRDTRGPVAPHPHPRSSRALLPAGARWGTPSRATPRTVASGIPLLAAGFLAISPWHINLSRTATENVLVVFFISLGVLLYLLWLRKQRWYLLINSFFAFGITLLVYQAPRAFLPLFIPFLALSCMDLTREKRRLIVHFMLLAVCIVLPLIIIFSLRELSLRIRTVSIFATHETQLTLDQQLREDGVLGIPTLFGRVVHNKIVGYSAQFFQNYFKHYSFDFLFTDQGFPDRYRVPLMGLLYLFELPFLLYGAWSLIKDRKKTATFLLGWIALSPIGSALAFDDIPNLQRTLIVFPALSMLSAYGIWSLFSATRQTRFFSILIGCMVCLIGIYQVIFYLHQYYAHESLYRPWYRHDGYRELVQQVDRRLPEYKKAVITNRESAPAIFFLFFGKYDPGRFQSETTGKGIKDFDRVGFGKYEFSEAECPLRLEIKDGKKIITGERNVLYVNSSLCKEGSFITIHEGIKRKDGSEVFRIVSLP